MVYTFFSVDPWIIAARLNEYHGALRAGAIAEVCGFEVGRCTNMYKRTDSPFIFQPNPKVFGGNLDLNSTPATKFYLDTNILAIEAFTNRMVGRTFLAPVAAGSWTNHGLHHTATNVYHPRSPGF
uniref:Uncharacterized protein n=1 Tax=Brassica oleracea var. oleracea TaxID=109376 RepID=A0A0D3ARI2_BRAOL